MEKVPCKVGSWEILAIPGTLYTFGCGGNCFGPIALNEVEPNMDTNGIATAMPLHDPKT